MMRALYMSTARAVDANSSLILKAAGNLLQSEATTITAAAASSTTGLDVFLHVHDRSRETFLLHAQHLYGAALTASPTLRVDVIPILNQVALSDLSSVSDDEGDALYEAALRAPEAESTGLRLYTKVTMESKPAAGGGFYPLYRFVAVGGTFDHLHSGHKLLLTTAALYASDCLRCGVTGDALLKKKKFAESLQPIEVRKAAAEAFLRRVRPDLKLDIDTITDVSGGTDTIAEIEALTISPETEKSLPIINDLRAKNGGLAPLVGIPIPYVMTPSGHIISSTAIRERVLVGAASTADAAQ